MTDPARVDEQPRRRRWRRRRVVLVTLALLLVAGAAGTAGLWQVSASPRFCSACHIMEPYVQAWTASKHSGVTCVQCHYPPGFRDTLWVKFQAISQVAKWATRTYSSKPFAEVEDASCLRSGCHSPAQFQAKGVLTSARGVSFDHRPHLDPARMGQGLRCTSCHSQVVVDRHFEVAQAACFLCHFKGTKSGRELTPVAGCTGCHQPPKGEIVVGSIRFSHEDVVRRGVGCQKCHLTVVDGAGDAPRERCFGCHNQREKLDRYAETRLIHAVHVTTHPIECARCHAEIRHELPPPIGIPAAGHPAGVLAAATPGTP